MAPARAGVVLPVAASLIAVAGVVAVVRVQRGHAAHEDAVRLVAGRGATDRNPGRV